MKKHILHKASISKKKKQDTSRTKIFKKDISHEQRKLEVKELRE